MGYPYRTILCPIDFNENSIGALTHARRLAADMDGRIHLLHVLPILPTLADRGGGVAIDEQAEQEAQRKLKEIQRAHLSRRPSEIHTHIAFVSDVPKTILAYARKLAADLIVMATHGRGPLGHLFFGSVTEAVVRNAVCPVLSIHPGALAEAKSINPEAPAAGRTSAISRKSRAARR
jgi:nucleotide-binding universal stress UspA family protein